MLKKIYVDNYRCFKDFEFDFTTNPEGYIQPATATLLEGGVGTGKSSIVKLINLLKIIGTGVNDHHILFSKEDYIDLDKPITVIYTIELNKKEYIYRLEFEVSQHMGVVSLKNEQLHINLKEYIYNSRHMTRFFQKEVENSFYPEISFSKHLVFEHDHLTDKLKTWMKNILIIGNLHAHVQEIFESSLSLTPSMHQHTIHFLKSYLKYLSSFKFAVSPCGYRAMCFDFEDDEGNKKTVRFRELSEGERIIVLAAYVYISLVKGSTRLCVWDEPDSHITGNTLTDIVYRLLGLAIDTKSQLIFTTRRDAESLKFTKYRTFKLSRDSIFDTTTSHRKENPETYTTDAQASVVAGASILI